MYIYIGLIRFRFIYDIWIDTKWEPEHCGYFGIVIYIPLQTTSVTDVVTWGRYNWSKLYHVISQSVLWDIIATTHHQQLATWGDRSRTMYFPGNQAWLENYPFSSMHFPFKCPFSSGISQPAMFDEMVWSQSVCIYGGPTKKGGGSCKWGVVATDHEWVL